MKVLTIVFVATICQALGVHNIRKRANNDYTVSTVKPSAGAESSVSSSVGGFNAAKYQLPPYVAPQKLQYTPQQQLNYVVQPTYKFQSQSAPVSPVQYNPQPIQQQPQPQPQPQYTSRNAAYNTQPLVKIAIPQKVYNPVGTIAPTPAPYSLAGDVSSFKYSSPIVSYSNLGVIQQSVGKTAGSAQQEVPVRHHYSQQPSEPSPSPPQNPVPHPIIPTYSQPQQLIYRPRLQLPQIYNSVPQQSGPVSPPATPQKVIYNQAPQTFATIPRPQLVYQPSAQRLAATAPQQNLYHVPQQVAYAPVQPSHGIQSTQPVQSAHSVPQPLYVVSPQYQYNGGNDAVDQHA